MTTTFTIPTLETERLTLRAPQLSDFGAYSGFKMSERSTFTNGMISRHQAGEGFAQLPGEWALRGYGLFMAVRKDDPSNVIGGFGVFHPLRHEEPEFGWSLYDASAEGQGFVTEAMRAVIPWAWGPLDVDTAQSHIHEGNAPSVIVAKALGATLDEKQTEIANAPGGEFEDPSIHVNIWRHHKGALT